MTESGLLVDYLQLSTCGKGSKVERLEIDDRAAVLVPRYAISMLVFGESSRGRREEWSETQNVGETGTSVKTGQSVRSRDVDEVEPDLDQKADPARRDLSHANASATA